MDGPLYSNMHTKTYSPCINTGQTSRNKLTACSFLFLLPFSRTIASFADFEILSRKIPLPGFRWHQHYYRCHQALSFCPLYFRLPFYPIMARCILPFLDTCHSLYGLLAAGQINNSLMLLKFPSLTTQLMHNTTGYSWSCTVGANDSSQDGTGTRHNASRV